ncbi:hypothetical protein AVEN_205540-1 [Araneus ventricosus]|uniref:Uncharacterized protein n=1 Tax=Araneus ventricosus TaxID=182803 RepID=A0A4Y2V8J1_ARAVE|nr:hypothetical protein AVEN_205540-1 [Araneus ventricosus]
MKRPQEIVDDLSSRGYVINRITKMKSYRLKNSSAHAFPLAAEIKKKRKYLNIYNEKSICYFQGEDRSLQEKKSKATIYVINCSGFYHAAEPPSGGPNV